MRHVSDGRSDKETGRAGLHTYRIRPARPIVESIHTAVVELDTRSSQKAVVASAGRRLPRITPTAVVPVWARTNRATGTADVSTAQSHTHCSQSGHPSRERLPAQVLRPAFGCCSSPARTTPTRLNTAGTHPHTSTRKEMTPFLTFFRYCSKTCNLSASSPSPDISRRPLFPKPAALPT